MSDNSLAIELAEQQAKAGLQLAAANLVQALHPSLNVYGLGVPPTDVSFNIIRRDIQFVNTQLQHEFSKLFVK